MLTRTAEFMENVAEHVEDQHAHHLALHHHNATLTVHTDAPGVLEYGGAELADELAVLVA